MRRRGSQRYRRLVDAQFREKSEHLRVQTLQTKDSDVASNSRGIPKNVSAYLAQDEQPFPPACSQLACHYLQIERPAENLLEICSPLFHLGPQLQYLSDWNLKLLLRPKNTILKAVSI